MTETLHKLGMRREFLNLIKGIYVKPAANIIRHGRAKLSVYPSYQNCTGALWWERLWHFVSKKIQENGELSQVSNSQ